MDELPERITRLEVTIEKLEETLEEVSTDVKELRKSWNSAKGWIGGVIFTISALWGVFMLLWDYFKGFGS